MLAVLLLGGCAQGCLGDTFCEHSAHQLFGGSVTDVRVEFAAFGEDSLPAAALFDDGLSRLRHGLKGLWPSGVDIRLPEHDEIRVVTWSGDDGRLLDKPMLLEMEAEARRHRSSAHEATFWFLLTRRKIAKSVSSTDRHPQGVTLSGSHVGAVHIESVEQYSGNPLTPGILLESTALHELGHMVGLLDEVPMEVPHDDGAAAPHCTEELCVMRAETRPFDLLRNNGTGGWMYGWQDGTVDPGDLDLGARCREDVATLRERLDDGSPW